MTDKAYIVANEEQEREVLEKLEREGLVWIYDEKPTEWSPVKETNCCHLPYALITNSHVWWLSLSQLTDEEIVFDGRKEEKMSDKYVVSQEFITELKEWKEAYFTDTLDERYHYVAAVDLDQLPVMIKDWWIKLNKPTETNNRLIAIIRWVNGEDVFEVEKPKKWVVHELNTKLYVTTYDGHTGITPNHDYITKFDTKEEAQSWANSHQEVVEVVDV